MHVRGLRRRVRFVINADILTASRTAAAWSTEPGPATQLAMGVATTNADRMPQRAVSDRNISPLCRRPRLFLMLVRSKPLCGERFGTHVSCVASRARPPRLRKRRKPVRARAAEARPASELWEEWRPRSECFGSDAPQCAVNLTRTFHSVRPVLLLRRACAAFSSR
jgi:hypothetical protein